MTAPSDQPLPTAFLRVRAALLAAVATRARFLILVLSIAVAGVTYLFLDVPGPDTAWLLYAARETLHGARYTVDVAEINPPLIVWIKVPSIALAEATGLDPAGIWRSFVLLLIGVSLAFTARLLRLGAAGRHAQERRLLLVGFAAALLVLPEWEFGQKEHLSIIGTLPLLILAGARCGDPVVPRWLALVAGAVGGVGIAFKPHFALVGLGVEALVQLRARPRPSLLRTENLAVLAVGLVYLAAVTALTPAYWEFARTWADLYHRFLHVGTLLSIIFAPSAFLIFAVAAVLGLRTIAPAHARSLEVLATACIGYYLAAVAQHKGGLDYRFLPAVVAAYTALWWLLLHAGALPRSKVRRLYFGLAAGAVALLPLVSIGRVLRRGPLAAEPQSDGLPEAVEWVRSRAAGRPVLILSTQIKTAFPLAYLADVCLASRYPHLWQLAALYHEELWESQARSMVRQPLGRGPLERLVIEHVVEDFVTSDPVLVVVPPVNEEWWGAAASRRVDYLSYFRTDPRFARAFEAFEYDRTIGQFVFYRRASTEQSPQSRSAGTGRGPCGP